MKCGACGYEYESRPKYLDKVIRYKSGKRKGEIKEVEQEEIDLGPGDEPFHEIRFKKDVDEFLIRREYREQVITLYICPKCYTVRTEDVW